ncbi:hypothetical protein EYF80_053577 [Liparis tanakae]|uniref:Uncharacterized protein n=1 Tax=Liparis tanakae TaxID=230148 RepID=A0A4Z2F5Y6_9TELE|nr:hypothetical protein EYF80_053577 [Liparis tanakae]
MTLEPRSPMESSLEAPLPNETGLRRTVVAVTLIFVTSCVSYLPVTSHLLCVIGLVHRSFCRRKLGRDPRCIGARKRRKRRERRGDRICFFLTICGHKGAIFSSVL